MPGKALCRIWNRIQRTYECLNRKDDKVCVLVHNHPTDSAFSVEDYLDEGIITQEDLEKMDTPEMKDFVKHIIPISSKIREYSSYIIFP